MDAFKVVVTDPLVPSTEVEQEVIGAAGGVLEVADPGADLAGALRDADAVLNCYVPLRREVLEQLQRCKIIARYGIGVDNVDLPAAAERGIAVTNVPDYCVEEVATHSLALLLDLVRKVVVADLLVERGGWGASTLGSVRRVSALTVGLVGFGKIARRFGELLAPLGCEVLVHDPYVQAVGNGQRLVGLDEVIAGSDVVSLHCPLTEETRGLIDADRIATMRDGAILINVARGGLVVTGDVLDALRSGKLAGAALDTFDREPPDASSFADLDNLIVTPHSAWYSLEATEESRRKAATQVVKAMRGEPLDYRVG